MDFGIAGESALVLGGTKGLGFACAQALSLAGVRVTINGRHRAEGEAAAKSIGGVYIGADLASEADRQALIATVRASGMPAIIITNAGGPPTGQFEEIASDAWRRAFETNMLAPLEIVRAFLPAMKTRGYGRILNITSFVVKELYPNMSLSNSLRVGLTGAMGSMAREVASFGITVNGLLPGLMDTGALERVIRDRMKRTGESEAAVKEAMAASIPMRRLGRASDFGALAAFLASKQAGYITGQNICVDGGLTKTVI
jgi:3-oxoacyl-[acyl-carrier protein] reductase